MWRTNHFSSAFHGSAMVGLHSPRKANARSIGSPQGHRRWILSQHTHTRHLGPPPPISLKFDREAAYRIRTARNRREPAPAAPLTAPILTRRARFCALAPYHHSPGRVVLASPATTPNSVGKSRSNSRFVQFPNETSPSFNLEEILY